MKRVFAFVLSFAVAHPAHAFLGIGDITFDPTSYGVTLDQYNKMVEMYENAKKQLDTLVKVEKTITDAQTAYETLGNFNLKTAISGLKQNGNDVRTAAQLRAAVANTESGAVNSASYIQYQLSQLDQLDNLAKLRKASAENAEQAADKNTNAATSAAISAQSSASLAALAAAAEQRRIRDETARGVAAKATADNMTKTAKVYEAMGK